MTPSSLIPAALLACALTAGHAQAAVPGNLYAGLGLERQTLSIGNSDFHINALSAHAGFWLGTGIGIEIALATGLGDDSIGELTVQQPVLLRYGIRLRTPDTAQGTFLYTLFSGARATLDLQTDGDGYPGEEDFSGYHAAIGIGTRLSRRLHLDISYNNYQIDESLDLSGIRLGIDYALGGAIR